MKTLRHAVALVTTLVSLAAVACSGQGGSSSTDIEQEPTASAHTFKVRAEVMRLPADGSPEIYLHHEAIDGMVDPRGKAIIQKAMRGAGKP